MSSQTTPLFQNGHTNYPWRSANQQKTQKIQGAEKTPISPLIDSLPEMDRIDKLLDQRLWTLHTDSNLELFTTFFKKIIEANQKLFTGKTVQEKASILFNIHRDRVIELVATSPEWASLVIQLLNRFEKFPNRPDKNGIEFEIRALLRDRGSFVNSLFLLIAISKTLGVPSGKISLHSTLDESPEISFSPHLAEGVYRVQPATV